MNGYTLRIYVFKDALTRDKPLGIWLANQHELSVLLSIYTVLFELCFLLSIFFPRTLIFFLVGGILFQLGLYTMVGHPFFEHIVLLILLLPFVRFEQWEAWLHRIIPTSRARARQLMSPCNSFAGTILLS